MKIRSLTMLAALLLVATACGGGKSKAVGKWTIDTDSVMKLMEEEAKKKGAGDAELEMARNMIKQMAGSMKLVLELKSDNTFVASGSMPGEDKIDASGTWKVDGDVIEMTTTMENGKKKDPPESKKGKLVGDRIEVSEGDMKLSFKRI
jgi:hypothetical protein